MRFNISLILSAILSVILTAILPMSAAIAQAPPRTDIATAGFPSIGPATAPVTIVEFSDFECPYCGGLYPTIKQVEKNYPQTVRVVYRQFPLANLHPHAMKAAEASLCANEQKKFWAF